MATVVAHNQWCNDRCGTARTVLNSNHELRLFKNNITPTPATLTAAFMECDFDTYAAVDLTAEFGAATFIADGDYRTEAGPFLYATPATTGNTIYGWYIVNTSTGKTEWSQRFASSINFAVGAPAFSLLIDVDIESRSII